MKGFFVLVMALALVFGCQKADGNKPEMELHDIELAFQTALSGNACGGGASLSWFYDLLTKAEEDRVSMAHNGQYIGIISMIRYEGNTLFYTDFGLGSGGVLFYLFDCEGDIVIPSMLNKDDPFYFFREGEKKHNIIYSTLPLH